MKKFELNADITQINNGKVWFFTCDRKLQNTENDQVNARLTAFIDQWTSHEQKVIAFFQSIGQQIWIVAQNGDLSEVSGCGIDKLVHFMTELGSEFGVDFFTRDVIAINAQSNDEILFCKVDQLKTKMLAKEITFSDLLLNSSIGQVKQLKTDLWIPLDKSWVASYIRMNFGQI